MGLQRSANANYTDIAIGVITPIAVFQCVKGHIFYSIVVNMRETVTTRHL